MKEKTQTYPRLYIDIDKQKKMFNLYYYDNRYNRDGSLIVESTLIPFKENIKDKSNKEILHDLNKVQFDLLGTLIKKQRKVIEIYSNKDKNDQFRVISSSLELLFEYQNKFLEWFSNNKIL